MTHYTRRSFMQTVGSGVGTALGAPSFALTTYLDAEPTRKLNVALCGLGRYANVLKKGFAESQYCRLAGVVTGTPAKAAQWKQQYGLANKNVYSYQTFDQLKNNPDIDLVYITLPNGLHKDYAIRAAQAGKHVIVEKPMAFTVQDCQEMIDACQKAGVQLAVGYRLHYEPHHIELKRLGHQNVFGPVRLIEASLGYQLAGTPPDDWHLKKALAGGGPLMNLGVYCVQSGRYVLSEEPVSITAQYGPVTLPRLFKEVEENITWQLTFPGGAVCTSATTSNCNIDRFYAAADAGFFELNPALSYGPFQGRTSQAPFSFPVVNQQAAMLDDIGKHLLAKKPLPNHIAGIEGLKDMRVIEGIYRAADSGSRVTLPRVD